MKKKANLVREASIRRHLGKKTTTLKKGMKGAIINRQG